MSAEPNTPPSGGQIVDKDGPPCPFLKKLPAEIRLGIYKCVDDVTFCFYCEKSKKWVAVNPMVSLMRTCKTVHDEVTNERRLKLRRAIVIPSESVGVAVANNQQASAAASMMPDTRIYPSISPSDTVYSQTLNLDWLPYVARMVRALEIQIDITPSGISPPLDALSNLMKALSWGINLSRLTLSSGPKTWWDCENWDTISDMPSGWALEDFWDKLDTNKRASLQLPQPLQEGWFKRIEDRRFDVVKRAIRTNDWREKDKDWMKVIAQPGGSSTSDADGWTTDEWGTDD
ncbi:hypothetical protein MBLNU457_4194t1 [Dothideomycetes sp. NU457]